MGNASNKEKCCIEKSHEARLAAAKSRLAELKNNGVPFENPISDLSGGITWNESLVGKLKQIALLPLMLVYVLVSFITTPIAYVLHLWQTYNKKQKLRREIKSLESEPLPDQVPDVKTLGLLWELYGLEDRIYSREERLNLLDAWIGILFGREVSENLGVRSRVAGIAERNIKANLPYHLGEDDAPHFLFEPPVDSLFRELSEELPPYQ